MDEAVFGIPELPRYLASVDKEIRLQAPEHIAGVRRMLGGTGKRLRPILVLAVAYHSGQPIDDRVIKTAAAVELVHIASLIHDDIMDGGTLRWGLPTISAHEGTESAILAGDYLLAKGCGLAAEVSVEAARVLADTIVRLCEGQAVELADTFNADRTERSLILAVKGKTSSMFSAACVLGAIISGLPAIEVAALRSFSEYFGVAFQYLDDVRDFTATSKTARKSVGNDIRQGNYTLPVIFSLRGKNGSALKKLLEEKTTTPARIMKIIEADGSIERTVEEAASAKRLALDSLSRLSNTELATVLVAAAQRYLTA